MRTALSIVLAVLIAGAAILIYSKTNGKGTPKYRLEPVSRGDVVATVTASGTLSALATVKVGSQVSGIISALYADFNSNVKKGQLLAELDQAPFRAIVDQRKADLERAKVELQNADLAFQRARRLRESQLISESEYDTAESNVRSAQAAMKQSEAALRQSETNLDNTHIVSPVNGVVVDRQYDIGQTVAASFQAPTLFTIAEDLTRMRVSTDIDESDIGRIRLGQRATFTVDAYPDRVFEGRVSQIRLSSQVVQNVVTYPVMIDVENPGMVLKPGMTANVTIPYEERRGVLRVPNAALRFQPDPSDLRARRGRESQNRGGNSSPRRRAGNVVYTLGPDGKLSPVEVRASLTDGNFTAVEPGNVNEGDQVVIGLSTARAMESTGGMVPMGRRGRF